jgi:hypothetical protein
MDLKEIKNREKVVNFLEVAVEENKIKHKNPKSLRNLRFLDKVKNLLMKEETVWVI